MPLSSRLDAQQVNVIDAGISGAFSPSIAEQIVRIVDEMHALPRIEVHEPLVFPLIPGGGPAPQVGFNEWKWIKRVVIENIQVRMLRNVLENIFAKRSDQGCSPVVQVDICLVDHQSVV